MKLVETEPQSPFDALWREFPQLKNATCIGRMSWGRGVLRTFRTLEGKYLRIESTEKGNELCAVPEREVEIYEDVWKRLGPRAIENERRPSEGHGIVFASYEFSAVTEDRILSLDD